MWSSSSGFGVWTHFLFYFEESEDSRIPSRERNRHIPPNRKCRKSSPRKCRSADWVGDMDGDCSQEGRDSLWNYSLRFFSWLHVGPCFFSKHQLVIKIGREDSETWAVIVSRSEGILKKKTLKGTQSQQINDSNISRCVCFISTWHAHSAPGRDFRKKMMAKRHAESQPPNDGGKFQQCLWQKDCCLVDEQRWAKQEAIILNDKKRLTNGWGLNSGRNVLVSRYYW